MTVIETIIENILDDFTSREIREFVYLTNEAIEYLTNEEKRINTGSFAEGITNFEDIDKMFISDEYLVVDSINDITNDIDAKVGILIIDAEDCNPGFVRLLLHKDPNQYISEFSSLYNGRRYFDGNKWMSKILSISPIWKQSFTRHGPAIRFAMSDDKILNDSVFSLECKENLNSTMKILNQFPCEIPNNKKNFFFVSKSHQLSKNPDIEFRWSFSVIEYKIIRGFSDKEFQLYFICKELYNTHLKSNDENESCISSYTVKTLILYFTERKKDEIKVTAMLDLVKLFLNVMKSKIQNKYLPNYFIREYNMFDVLQEDESKKMVAKIEKIENGLILAILKSKKFSNFPSLKTLHSRYQIVSEMSDTELKYKVYKKMLIENSYRNFDQGEPPLQIKEYLEEYMQINAWGEFQAQIDMDQFFEILCLYFHCSSIFESKYSATVIEKFKFLFSRFLTVYLTGVPMDSKTNLIHLLIEVLLHRLMYLPNEFPSISFDFKTPLAFYYYLRKDKVNAAKLLSPICGKDVDCRPRIPFLVHGNFKCSIVLNDGILKKYFDSQQEKYFSGISLTPDFLFLYIYVRIIDKNAMIHLDNLKQKGKMQVHEAELLDILKENIDEKHFLN